MMSKKIINTQKEILKQVLDKLGTPPNLWNTNITNIPDSINYRVNLWVEVESDTYSRERKIAHSYYVTWEKGKIVKSSPPIEKEYDS